MNFNIIDKIYDDIIKSEEANNVIPKKYINETMIKKIENTLNIKDLSEELLIKKIELIFSDSQNVSSMLLNYSSKSLKKNDIEDLMFTIDSSKKKALNKIKSFLGGDLLDPIHIVTIKDIFSDLVIEKHKYKKMEHEINELIIDTFICHQVILLTRKEILENNDNFLFGARVSLIKNLSSLKVLIDTNTAITNNLVQYVQSLSPELFNELMLNYFSLIDLNSNYSKDVKLKIEKINVVKKMIREKINEFYSLDNIKKLNNIYKQIEKNKNINVENEISKIKMDIEVLKMSLVKLKNNLNSNIESLQISGKNEDDKNAVDKIIDDCHMTLENMEDIILSAEKKINLMF